MGRRGPKSKRNVERLVSEPTPEQIDRRKAVEVGVGDLDEYRAMETALMARWRVHGVRLTEVKDQRAGTAIGRLAMLGPKLNGLSRAQYDAAKRYEEVCADFDRAFPWNPHRSKAVDLNAVRGQPVAAENEAAIGRARERMSAANTCIQDLQNVYGLRANFNAALFEWIKMDREMWHMLGDLKLVLNALARLYQIEDKEEAA